MAVTHGKFGILHKWNGTGTNLAAEACTVAGNDAQITDTAKRILNPNSTDLAFTPTNAVTLLGIDHANGTAHFSAAPGVTTCTGTLAYVLAANLIKTAQLFEWSLDFALASHDITEFQLNWRTVSGGVASASGSIGGFLAGSNWFDDIEDETDGTMGLWYMDLYSYDPDDDETGDKWGVWALFTGLGINVTVGDIVKEQISFDVFGYPPFRANS